VAELVRLTVLGCCGTYPAAGRACSGYLLEAPSGGRVWVDAGSGTLANLLARTDLPALDAIWISHLHADHVSDLALAGHALLFGPEPTARPLPLLGPTGMAGHLRATMPTEIPGVPDDAFEVHELHDGERVGFGQLELEAVATEHGTPTFGLRASAGGPTLAYSADTGPCDGIGRLAERADLLLCEASWLDRPNGVPPVHLTAEQAGRWAAEGRAGRLVLTHLRPDADPALAVEQAASAFGGPVGVAHQGEVLTPGH
jgi:ribonuclease BN (tRNA processing enzyme)